jgi:hypothetical protein
MNMDNNKEAKIEYLVRAGWRRGVHSENVWLLGTDPPHSEEAAIKHQTESDTNRLMGLIQFGSTELVDQVTAAFFTQGAKSFLMFLAQQPEEAQSAAVNELLATPFGQAFTKYVMALAFEAARNATCEPAKLRK